MGQPGDHRAVLVIPLGKGEPGLIARGRTAPFSRDHQATLELFTGCENRCNAVFRALTLGHFGHGHPIDKRFVRRRFKQGQTKSAIGEHAAQRALRFIGHEIEATGLLLIGHRDGGDVAGKFVQTVGNSDIGEHMPARGRDRRGAVIEAFGGQFSGVSAVDDVARHPLLSRCKRERHAHKPSAKDQQIGGVGALRHSVTLRVEFANTMRPALKALP